MKRVWHMLLGYRFGVDEWKVAFKVVAAESQEDENAIGDGDPEVENVQGPAKPLEETYEFRPKFC